MAITLTAPLVEAFAGMFLSHKYDGAKPTPQFHREAWGLYCSDAVEALCVAPRDHAKSTSLTFVFSLASVCFRVSDYVIIIGSTEPKASEQLSNIADELRENVDLRQEFGIKSFESDQKTEIIVECEDGYRFRILARGAEQKIRGSLWKNKRPNLIICDDMEDDEQVESKARRLKFRKWFFRAVKPALSKSGKIRVHGTILHEDSLLARLRKNKAWKSLFYKAHRAYDDFSDLLWPERWTEEQLRAKRLEFEEEGDPGGYSQEYLNTPLDYGTKYLNKDNFLPMSEDDHLSPKRFYVGCDFAVSKTDVANKTSFTVGGVDINNLLHVVEERLYKWDSTEWVEELFSIQKAWNPDAFFVEGGVIWSTVAKLIEGEMLKRNTFLNISVFNPVKDKAARGKSLQRRMKARSVRFDTAASWYPGYLAELLTFTGVSDAKEDDQFDSTATLCIGLDSLPPMEEEDLQTDEEQAFYQESTRLKAAVGRSSHTGY